MRGGFGISRKSEAIDFRVAPQRFFDGGQNFIGRWNCIQMLLKGFPATVAALAIDAAPGAGFLISCAKIDAQ